VDGTIGDIVADFCDNVAVFGDIVAGVDGALGKLFTPTCLHAGRSGLQPVRPIAAIHLYCSPVAYPQGKRRTCPPRFEARGQSCKSPPPSFLTHSDAIAGFTSESLGLPAYACKTAFNCNKIGFKNASKLAILSLKIKNKSEEGA